MLACDTCQSPIEPFEVKCHHCGVDLETEPALTVPEDMVAEPVLAEAYQSWLGKGAQALKQKDYGQASVCFAEALKRAHGLKNAQSEEFLVRRKLASTLEKLDKLEEASEQYQLLVEMAPTDDIKAKLETKLTSLSKNANQEIPAIADNSFYPISGQEHKHVPLYCPQCKRLLAEAEIYTFRNSKTIVTFLCGHSGEPLVKHDRLYQSRLKEADEQTLRANLVTKIASRKIIRGKSKTTASLLAVVLGCLGMHRFYLEERGAGYLFLSWFSIFFIVAVSLTAHTSTNPSISPWFVGLAWFLAIIPCLIALVEAVQLIQMDDIAFNLAYNLDLVLSSIPPMPTKSNSHMDVFSMEISDEPDDLPSL